MGPERPPRVSPIARQVARQIKDSPSYVEGADPIVEVERNLESLTRGIAKYASIDEVSLCYQRHTIGVFARLHQLLGQVIRAVLCYREHHVGK